MESEMIKVRAGQVWEFESGASNYLKGDRLRVMNLDRAGTFHDAKPINIERPSAIYSVSSKFLNECFNFIPQSDLEWLAVKVSEWSRSMSSKAFIARGGCNTVIYSDDDNGVDYPQTRHTLGQWQNMRYYLGLDKKDAL